MFKKCFLVFLIVLASPLTRATMQIDVVTKISRANDSSESTLAMCEGAVNDIFECLNTGLPSVHWRNRSMEDWAGAVGRVQLEVNSPDEETIGSGSVIFTYMPTDNIAAVALKLSEGGDDLVIRGVLDDFTDIEGRRLLWLKKEQPIEFIIQYERSYPVGQSIENFSVELTPVEFYN